MASLTEGVQAISLQTPSPPKATKSAISDQIYLPVPRRLPAAKDHRIVYGFVITYEWLLDYCEQNARHIHNYNPAGTSHVKMFAAMNILRAISGVRNLRIEGVYCNARDPSLELERSRPGSVPVVSVCSSMESSYNMRPTKAQMEKLRSIIQKEPDWYVDVHHPSYYTGY